MLIINTINDFFKDAFTYPVHAVAKVAAHEITAIIYFGVSRLRDWYVEFLRIPLTEGIMSFRILHLLGNDSGLSTSIVGKRHTILTNVRLRLIRIATGGRVQVVLLYFEWLESSPRHVVISLLN